MHPQPIYMIKTKMAFSENRLLSSQSEQFEKLSKSSDWLEKLLTLDLQLEPQVNRSIDAMGYIPKILNMLFK